MTETRTPEQVAVLLKDLYKQLDLTQMNVNTSKYILNVLKTKTNEKIVKYQDELEHFEKKEQEIYDKISQLLKSIDFRTTSINDI